MYQKFMSFIGLSICFMSSIMIVGAVGLLFDPQYHDKVGMVILLVFSLLFAIGGFMMYRHHSRKAERRSREYMEQDILKLAAEKHGKITPAEVVLATKVGIDEAKVMLDNFCANDLAQLNITDKGVMVYVFDGFLSEEEKDTAKSPLEI